MEPINGTLKTLSKGNTCPHKALSVALLLTCPPLKWEDIREGQKSVIDNPSVIVCGCLAACSLLSLQVWKGSHWHLVFCYLSLILHYALKQDLKDLMRKAGEVTFVDAHRPNKNEGWVALLWVKLVKLPLSSEFGPNPRFCFKTEWSSLHLAVTWRMPSPSLMGQNWMDGSWKSLRTAESELFLIFFSLHVCIFAPNSCSWRIMYWYKICNISTLDDFSNKRLGGAGIGIVKHFRK